MQMEDFLNDALVYAGCESLPQEAGADSEWLKAIVKYKCLNNEKYGIARRGDDGQVYVSLVFDPYPVGEIVSIHPYLYANTEKVKKVEGSNEEQKPFKKSEVLACIKKEFPDYNISKLSRMKLNEIVEVYKNLVITSQQTEGI